MNNALFLRYVRLLLAEDERYRSFKDDEPVDEENDINEFSGVGSIVGYSGPLGINPDALGRKKNKDKR